MLLLELLLVLVLFTQVGSNVTLPLDHEEFEEELEDEVEVDELEEEVLGPQVTFSSCSPLDQDEPELEPVW